MIRECTNEDMEMLSEYLSGEDYGRVILAAMEAYGFSERFQTAYVDVKNGKCDGVYLWLHGNLLLYSRDNQVGIDFLEQMFGIEPPELVAGRKDNVNIVSWLLTDYYRAEGTEMPVLRDRAGKPVEGLDTGDGGGAVWCVLSREEQGDGSGVS